MKKINVIWQVDPDVMLEKDWLDFLLVKTDFVPVVDGNLDVVLDDSIVVTRGYSIGNKSVADYLRSFVDQGFNQPGVIHLSDEWFKSPVDFYDNAAFVLRNFYRPDVASKPNVYFFPLGYKRGYLIHNAPKAIKDRQYLWFFAGQLGGKLSRRKMVKYAEKLPGGLISISERFGGSDQLGFEDYVKLMGDTVFALSPGGNKCVETHRIYEAMESGAIPIVEDVSKLTTLKSLLKEVLTPKEYKEYRVWSFWYWKIALYRFFSKSYWHQVYGADFPCIRCTDWKNLQIIMKETDVDAVASAVQSFWSSYKQSLQAKIVELVDDNFSESKSET
jgi:hypothetical protein